MNPTSDFSSSQVVYAGDGSTLEDVSDNVVTASSTTFIVANIDAPRIISGTLALDNSYVLIEISEAVYNTCLLYTSPSPRDLSTSRMPSSA